ncbi:hypothetical protein GCM10023091_22270 [Ravibacter arvi]|uniref:4Fe-4S ferredoxin-type domain-containing protein n=1 Tax=Ravibacter arvi TaxID=2051041 RepID=A0ABP8LZT7_9BACT
MPGYFKNIADGVKSTLTGMGLTLRHALEARRRRKASNIQLDNFFDVSTGMVTVQYPLETVPIPDHGRYRLHNEMDDCIVCDKCAKVCPVDCIDIEPIKATEEVGKASDGSVIRLYAARFDIDMAKCCYCGLCTTVCPTECLTMTKTFDYSEFDVREMVYAYGNLTPEQAQEKRDLLEQFQLEKAQGKGKATAAESPAVAKPKPVFKPMMKPAASVPATEKATGLPREIKSVVKFNPKNWTSEVLIAGNWARFAPGTPLKQKSAEPKKTVTETEKPAFKPSQKPAVPGGFQPRMKPKTGAPQTPPAGESAKPAFKPTMKPKADTQQASSVGEVAKPAFKPTMKPKAGTETVKETPSETPKPAFRPTMKPKAGTETVKETPSEAPKPAFTPTMKPKAGTETVKETPSETPKPAFRPTMKPKAGTETVKETLSEAPKPAFRPTMKPKADTQQASPASEEEKPAFRPTIKPLAKASGEPQKAAQPGFAPTMKPKAAAPSKEADQPIQAAQKLPEESKANVKGFHPASAIPANAGSQQRPVFKPGATSVIRKAAAQPVEKQKFHPKLYSPQSENVRPSFGNTEKKAASKKVDSKPALKREEVSTEQPLQTAKPKSTFRPTMKPKK